VNGGVIEFWSLDNPDGPRGRSYDLVIPDEAAMLPTSRIFEAVISPTIGDRQGKAVFPSTPRGMNWFYRYFLRGQNPQEYPDWRSFQFPTAANPHFHKNELAIQQRNLPARIFREEFLAEFLSGEDAIFRITDDILTGVWQDSALPGHVYVAGIDFARSQDFSVIEVLDVTDDAVLEHVHQDRSVGIEWELQIARIVALHERFGFLSIVAEANAAGSPIIERLLNLNLPVVPFQTTNISKTMIINELSLAIEGRKKQIHLLNDDVLIGELRSYEATRLPSNLVRYNAPKDGHDDCVMALALATFAAEGYMASQAGFVRFA
jgi:hypothetical protein